MAKKEYFDGKLGPLFKMTGAISVDRFGDAKLIFISCDFFFFI